MIHYINGSRYEKDSEEFALTPQEWARLQRAKSRITVFNYATGEKYIIRRATQAETNDAKEE